MNDHKCITCGSCGMPLHQIEDFAGGDHNAELCKYCVREDGTPMDYAEIFQGTADHLVKSQGITKKAAHLMAHQLLSRLPYWSDKLSVLNCTPLSISIKCPYEKAFSFISDPQNLPQYSGFVKRIFKEGNEWMGETIEGVLPHRFVIDAKLGVFDVYVTEPTGFILPVCSRLLVNQSGCEYMTSVVQPPYIPDDIYQQWIEAIKKELLVLKSLLE